MADARTQPTGDSYDAIVVGSGLGGLSAAAYLARFGRKVLVVERLDGAGGYAHAFKRGPYVIDPAIHVIAQAGEGQTVDLLLKFLGVRDRCEFHPSDALYRVALPGITLDAPFHREPFTEAHIRQFPHEADGIRRFMETCHQFFQEARQVPVQLPLRELDEAVRRFPVLFKYRALTAGEVLDEFFTDPSLKAAISASWTYMGLPPSRLSFELFARFLYTQLDGIYHCQGSFQNLVDAFVAALEQHGGELVVGNQVSRILVEDGRATGVALADGRQVRAPVVVSNADAHHTFETLVGLEHLPDSYIKRLTRLRPSLSMFIVYAATRLDLHQFDPAHETFIYHHVDHDDTYRGILNGQPGGLSLVVPTLLDPTLAPPGEHLVVCAALAPYEFAEPWPEARTRYQEAILDEVEARFPGFRAQMTFVENATPRALERYTMNYRGAAYGWENSPAQSASKRLTYQTPIDGLYLSGHWAQAASALRVIVSGTHTAKLILHNAGEQDTGPEF